MHNMAQKQIFFKKTTRAGSGSGFGGEISGSGKKVRIRNTAPRMHIFFPFKFPFIFTFPLLILLFILFSLTGILLQIVSPHVPKNNNLISLKDDSYIWLLLPKASGRAVRYSSRPKPIFIPCGLRPFKQLIIQKAIFTLSPAF